MKATLWAMITATVFGGLVLCTGCGKSDNAQISETAKTFMSGSANGDRSLMESTLTKLAREKVADGSVSVGGENGMGHNGYTIGTPAIDGESASVPVTITKRGESAEAEPATVTEVGEDTEDTNEDANHASSSNDAPKTEIITLKLRRENGEWKIWAMRVPLVPNGPTLTMDFEHPEAVIGDAFKQMGEGVGAAMKGIGQGLGEMFKGIADGARAAEKAANTPASGK